MKDKVGYKPEYKNKYILVINNIEKRLRIFYVILLVLMLIPQILLYNRIGNEFLNPVYKMEEKLFNEDINPIYTLICIYGDISEFEDVWVLKNGIPVSQLLKGAPVYVNVFNGDVIEIDARDALDIPHEIYIDNMSSDSIRENFPNKIILRDNICLLQPFY